MRKYIIVGNGPAGVTAAAAIKENEANSDITIFDEETYGFYSRPGLAYYLTGEISLKHLFLQQSDTFTRVKNKIIALNPKEHFVTVEHGQKYFYDALLLATGSSANTITIPGADLKGIIKLDNLNDAKHLDSIAGKSKAGIVIGGGITALEIVEVLIGRGIETHYLLRSDRYWPNVLDEIESRIVETRLKSHGVYLHHNTELARIIGKKGTVAAVETQDGKHLDCQLLAVAIGVQPRIELAVSAGLRTERGILTNEFLQTSDPDIFAAGDAVQALDVVSGKLVLETLWANAVNQGQLAGINMTGKRVAFRKGIAFNVTRLAGITTTIIGNVGTGKDPDIASIARGDSEVWGQLPNVMAIQSDLDINRTRILLGSQYIKGAVVMGDQTLSRPLCDLIAHKVDITAIRDKLCFPGANFAKLIIEFWSDGNYEQAAAAS